MADIAEEMRALGEDGGICPVDHNPEKKV